MKNKTALTFLLLILAAGCRKDRQQPGSQFQNSTQTLTLAEVKDWYGRNNSLEISLAASPPSKDTLKKSVGFKISSLPISWDKAQSINSDMGNYWIMPTTGQPVFGKIRQGYRKLAFIRNSKGDIQPRILEIIPDALYYLVHKVKMDPAKFNGRIFVYDQDYHLISGQVFSGGIVAGYISNSPKAAAIKPTAMKARSTSLSSRKRVLDVYTVCDWTDYNYINSEGIFTDYAEQDCNSYGSYGGDTTGMSFSGGAGGGGGGDGNGGSGSDVPDFDLPDGNNPATDPKKMMDCFTNLPDIGSKMTVTIYVVEPLPGTSFAIGTNSVGHTAIGLSKTYNGTTITQIVGFYPDATGKSKLHAPSKIEDNGGDLPYNVSISYPIIASTFNQIVQYISNPPTTYDLTEFNCTNFVYNACQAGGITLPNPYSTISTDGFGGFVQAMTPGALGNSIANLQGVAPVTGSGITPFSKGPCE